MAVTEFGRPIPGNSLTTHKPGDRPWERPPELASVEDALSLYMAHVMRGRHSLDVGLLVAPALMEFMAAVGDTYGVNYKFSNKDAKKEMENRERSRMSLLITSALDEGTDILEDMSSYLESDMTREEAAEAEPMMEDMPQEMTEEEQQPPQMPEQTGLMARG